MAKTTYNKHSAKIKTLTAGRLDKLSIIIELKQAVKDGLVTNIDDAMHLSDVYFTQSQIQEIVKNDVEYRFNESLTK